MNDWTIFTIIMACLAALITAVSVVWHRAAERERAEYEAAQRSARQRIRNYQPPKENQ